MDKKRKPIFAYALILLCIIILCLYLTLHIFLPGILSSYVFPKIAQKAGILSFSCEVKRIGLFGADFASIKIGDKQRAGLLIDGIKIDYSPLTIIRKNIKTITVSGVKIFYDYEKDNLIIPGLYPFPSAMSGEDPENISSPVNLKEGSTKVEISQVSLTGHFITSDSGKRYFIGELKLSDSSINDNSLQIKLSGIQGMLPVKFPCEDFSNPGNFLIKDIVYYNKNVGTIEGSIKQEGIGVKFEGNHKSLLLPGFAVALTGSMELTDSNNFLSKINFKANPFTVKNPIDLGQFVPEASGAKIIGVIRLFGNFSYDESNIKSSLKAYLANAVIEIPESKILISGINTEIYLTDLFEIKSAPRQLFKFGSAAIGNIEIKDGWFEYQIESLESFYIEKGGFNWCNGRVDIERIKISESIDDYNVVLYCDNLDIASILEQLGAAGAEGSGSVSGKIPVRYNKGKITFNDGLLSSTPGGRGRIKFRDTKKLAAIMPQDSVQVVQIEIAREALKDFQYNSARIGLNTENEDLLLSLEFDGKPTNPLPFVYKKDLGRFVKIEAGQKGSVFQGIKLNVNFRLPLEKALQYKDVLNMLK